MKKLFYTSLLTFCSFAIFGQVIFRENFEGILGGSFPAGWMRYNVDGLNPALGVGYVNNAWVVREDVFTPNVQDSCAISTSWYNPAGQADDWMATPAITIPANGSPTLSWRALAPDFDFPDGYEVVIATDNTLAALQAGTVVFTTPAEAQSWTQHVVQLGAYAGQSIYIGFHNFSTAQFVLMVDDIAVYGAPPQDIAILPNLFTNYTSMPVSQVTPLQLNNNVTNLGDVDATNVFIDYTVLLNGVPYTTATSNLAPLLAQGAAAIGLDAGATLTPAVGTYTVEAVAQMDQTDDSPANNTTFQTHKVDPQLYARDYAVIDNVVDGSVGIGAGAGANSVIGSMYDCVNASDVLSIRFYLNSPVAGDSIEGRIYDVVAGVPSTIIGTTAPYIIQPQDTLGVWLDLPLLSPVGVSPGQFFVGITEDSNDLTLGVTAETFVENTFFVNWDNNPFGGWTAIENFGFGFENSLIIRAIMAPDCAGLPVPGVVTDVAGNNNGSIDLSPVGLDPFAFSWSNGETTEDISGLGIGTYTVSVTDANGCSGSASFSLIAVGVSSVEEAFSLNVFPNPANNAFQINLDLANATEVRMDLYNALGQSVKSITQVIANQGSINVDTRDLSAGTYILRVSIAGESVIRAVQVVR